jgi:predicted dinucleotide-binding enzyme
MKKIGILGSGVVGRALAAGFLKHGYSVTVGTGTPAKLSEWNSKEAVEKAGAHSFSGKTVIDTTNPIADAPPQNGVLKFFTTLDDSLMEQLQRKYPQAKFVKAFSCVGSALMVNPAFPGGKPSMFISGNNAEAKAEVGTILGQFGWETEDMGTAESARAIEPLCMLWCIPGFQRNQWMHAFKLLKMEN